jgi:kinesin family protein 2/24
MLRQTVEAIFEEEERILDLHMSNIQETAELLTREGVLLADVQRPGSTDDDMERYATELEQILDRKEDAIAALRNHISVYREHLRREQELSERVGSLSM